ncbi:thioesterase family protein [Algoriphagus sp.]|uniref:acyl-CoA thioesterase n=1 Tax=Algoriphagus sp. TaxID=1872435 RepID=UPI0025E3DB8C|nr:thioesterase family protein [Algoriphagus sp.]
MPKIEVSDIIGKHDFSIPIQIRFSDIDGYQHVNNGVYFNYFEHARASYLLDYCGWNIMEVGTVVAHVGIDYFKPIHLSDQITAYVKCTKIGNTSFDLEQYIIGKTPDNSELVFSKCHCTLVSVDMKTMKPTPIPAEYRTKLEV